MDKSIDCVVCGSCTVDVLVKPFSLAAAIGAGRLIRVDPIQATTGGLVSNAGTALARFGMRVAALSYTGDDEWAWIIRRKYQAEGIDTSRLLMYPSMPTSTTVVFIDAEGERSFAHCQGAPRRMDRTMFFDNRELFERSRAMLMGYYSLMPNLENDLPEILSMVRQTGCLTALDAAGDGGTMQPLDRILPHLDFYVPSLAEAASQTGETDPQRIIEVYRNCGAPGLLGVKLGARGALLSPQANEFAPIEAVPPPGAVVDTTGAGDCFYAGLLAGLLRGMSIAQAGRLAAAAGACCVTGLGASAALRGFDETLRLSRI